jgi:hypothetical protein
MKITIESTLEVTTIDGVQVRKWKGTTEDGVPCFVFVHRIGVALEQDQSDFERELKVRSGPGRVIPLGYLL